MEGREGKGEKRKERVRRKHPQYISGYGFGQNQYQPKWHWRGVCRSEARPAVQRVSSAAEGRRTDDRLAASAEQRCSGSPLHHRVPYSGSVGAARRGRFRRAIFLQVEATVARCHLPLPGHQLLRVGRTKWNQPRLYDHDHRFSARDESVLGIPKSLVEIPLEWELPR